MTKKLMLGNAAFARGAWEAGATVAAAYPGTPSTEITENVATYDEILAQWAPNEKVALEVAIGASFGGARALCAMKHVGLNVAADPLFTAAYTGVNGGLVIVVADDPGMNSSQNEQDSRFYARSAHVPMLEPSDSHEAKEFVKAAFELSEKYDTPVFVRSNTRLSHSQGVVELMERADVALKPYVKDIPKYVMMPGMARKRHVIVEQRMNDIKEFANSTELNKVEMNDTAIGVITAGVTYNDVKEALPNASVLKLGMIYPLPAKTIADFAAKVDKLYIVEELEPFFEDAIKAMGIDIIGKEIFTLQGEYSANMIAKGILGKQIDSRDAGVLPMRPPVMCPGCPHRAVYHVLKKLKIMATGDIGCYTLGALPPHEGIDMCVCMGASISMATGLEKARGKDFARKLVAVIGDSTFFHSGITGLVDMVYNGATSTVMILDNSTTGMTGHQDHPSTGKNLKGDVAAVIDIETLVRGLGVKNVRTVDPFDMKALEVILKEETAREEVSVIITQRPCALLPQVPVLPALHINDTCTSCGMCMKLGCPAIERHENGMWINETLCNGCGLCVKVCKFDSIKKAGE
ncbi:MAG: indolepyruvate ferredoxin oxidoreductase subunit alpha [Clostridia bacterium]|jgi:indolepyruvate ferredoxin oxidoreductase, alpha subunit|nr:indolepyruvate ferredoxin oxidoreductase subunit alpha [Clostridia bacterium]